MHIVADIGGTKTRMAGVFDDASFADPVIVDTPQTYTEGIAFMAETARRIAGDTPIESFVGGIAGVLSRDKNTLLGAPHLHDWKNKNVGIDLSNALSTKVHLENDVALVGLGEAKYGAGKDASIVVYMTVSTGVNGVRIVDGLIDRAAWGFETGGQYIFMEGTAKTLEHLISGTAVSEKFGMPPKQIEKDSAVWEELSIYTAYGLHNTILHWSPHRVVLGGSMFNEVGISVDRVAVHVREIMKKFPEVPDIVHSSLGDLGGLWGGLAYLKKSDVV